MSDEQKGPARRGYELAGVLDDAGMVIRVGDHSRSALPVAADFELLADKVLAWARTVDAIAASPSTTTESPKGPAEPISAGLAPLYALAKRWAVFARDEAGGMCSGEAAEAGRCARDLLAALPDVATDLNFKINNWRGQQAREGLKK